MSDEQSVPPMPTEPPAPSPKQRPGWLVPVSTGIAGLVLGIGSTLLVQAAGGDDEAARTFTLTGTVEVMGDTKTVVTTNSGLCGGTGGYNDLRGGASVTVYDKAGLIVGTGSLGSGTVKDAATAYKRTCRFAVSVPDVPRGKEFYQVEVSHRGKVNVSESDAVAGLFAASIGD
ncbi:hypothetical protein ACFVT6_19595 [Streptomyces sp. NPDC058049]|uniref:hypothetical protein n=1 Tax=Streptomyces sp. NPDC058049 TaxID=3346314 RepID=UPI0036EAF5C5